MRLNIKKIASCVMALWAPFLLFGQEATKAATPAPEKFSFDINMVLIVIAIVLLLPLYLSTRTLLYAVKEYVIKSATNKKIGMIILLLGASQMTFAQTTNSEASTFPVFWSTAILLAVIAFEIFFIAYFSLQTRNFLKTAAPEVERAESFQTESWLERMWNKANSFRPMEEENNIDTGHSYDGIRELDNITPPWFTTSFLLCIAFGIFYLYRYHVAHSAPLQIEEFKTEMAVAEAEKVKYLATQTNNVDESNVKLLGAADIAEGQKIFVEKCAACHQAHGGSMPGGVGPNLTDNYWIHGGTIVDVFKTLKYGWPEKGMISWKDQMTPNQLAQTASFVLSIAGTNPPNAKEPQGELFSPEATTAAQGPTSVKDTTKLK